MKRKTAAKGFAAPNGHEEEGDVTVLMPVQDSDISRALQRVIATFPQRVIERGIHRDWKHILFLLRHMRPFLNDLPPGAHVCDLGSGAGIVPLVMATLNYHVSVVDKWSEYTADSDNQMGTWDEFCPRFKQFGVEVFSCDLLSASPPLEDRSQDLVTAFAILEHLGRPRRLLEEMWRLLKPGGLGIITVPNCANLRNRIRLLFGHSPHPDHWSSFYSDNFFGHYRELTRKELREILAHHGFEILDLRLSNSAQVNTKMTGGKWLAGWRPTSLEQLIRGLYLLVVALVPAFRYEILVVARKSHERTGAGFC